MLKAMPRLVLLEAMAMGRAWREIATPALEQKRTKAMGEVVLWKSVLRRSTTQKAMGKLKEMPWQSRGRARHTQMRRLGFFPGSICRHQQQGPQEPSRRRWHQEPFLARHIHHLLPQWARSQPGKAGRRAGACRMLGGMGRRRAREMRRRQAVAEPWLVLQRQRRRWSAACA